MFTHKKTVLSSALGAMVLLLVTACTPAPTDELPSLDGVGPETSAGWTTETCRDLTFARPEDWVLSERGSTAAQRVFENPHVAALEGIDDSGILPENFRVNCDVVPLPWDGGDEPSEEFLGEGVALDDVDYSALDVPGAEHAAVWVDSKTSTASSETAEPDEFTTAQIIAVTPDGRYFTVFFALPTNAASAEIIDGVASSLSIDEG